MRTLIFYSVWGQKHIDRFLHYALPTQLTPGNLLSMGEDSAVRIATREADVSLIASSSAYQYCASKLDTQIIPFPDKMFEQKCADKYSVVLFLQNYALGASGDYDAIIFGYADALWSEGSYRNALSRLGAGYDLALCVGFNVVEENVTDFLDETWSLSALGKRAIAPRDFAKLVCDNLHDAAASRLWGHPQMNNYPSFILWEVKGKGILARAFHLHPVAIRVRRDDASFTKPFELSLDEGLVPRLIRQGSVPYVSPSSDEMFVCGLLRKAEFESRMLYSSPLRPPNIGDVVLFAERNTTLHHRQFFEEPIRIIASGNADDEDWRAAEKQADRICASISRRLFLPDSVVRNQTPLAHQARIDRIASGVDSFRSEKILSWNYIKSTDTAYLSHILLHYADRRATRALSRIGLARHWPGMRRALRSWFKRRGPSIKNESPQTAKLESGRRPSINYILINTSFWQMAITFAYLAFRLARSKR